MPSLIDESVGKKGTKRKRASTEGDVDLVVAFTVNNHQILKTEAALMEGAQTLSPPILWAMTALFDKTGASGFIELDELYSTGFKGLKKNGTIRIQVHFNDVNHFFTSMWNYETEEVVIFDSLARDFTWQAKYQL